MVAVESRSLLKECPNKKARRTFGDTVVLRFELPNGEEKEVEFSERPLGLRYAPTMPLTIMEVIGQSHADFLGVKDGWVVKQIGAFDLTSKTMDQAYQALYDTTKHLPLV